MRKVKTDFFCIKTKKNYKAGDEYKGKRTDIDHVLEPIKKPKTKKPTPPKAPPGRTVVSENKQHPKTRKGAISKK